MSVRLWSALLFWLAGSLFLVPQVTALTPPLAPAEIVFANGGRIVSIKADGSERTVLTRKKAWVGQPWGLSDNAPSVSPDGGRIIFSRNYDGFKDGVEAGLMIMDRDGSNLRKLYEPPSGDELWSAAWDPDGTGIYAIEFHQDSSSNGDVTMTVRLVSVQLDGSGRQTILTSTLKYREKDESFSGKKMFPIDVIPSPDEEKLMIESSNFFEDVPNRLEWVDPETGARSLFEADAGSASFSPGGEVVVFASDRDRLNVECHEGRCSGDPQIFIKQIGTKTVSRLLPGKPAGAAWNPDFSPDGRRIAFESAMSPGASYAGGEIWTVAPDGSCLRRLTNGAPDSGNPEWMPGGSAEGCFNLRPTPLGEVTFAKAALQKKPRPLWAGPSFKGWLMDDTFLDGQDLGTAYNDCGAPDGNCRAPMGINSGPVCLKNLSSDLMLGQYLGIERRRGGLLVRNIRRNNLTLSNFYSGGRETRIASPGRYRGRAVGFGYHRKIVTALRPVTSTRPVKGSLGQAALPRTTVRKAGAMVKAYRATRSLRKAARQAGVFKERNFVGVRYSHAGARAWLKFGRDLTRLGKVRSVRCKRWKNDRAAVRLDSSFMDSLK